MNVRRARYSLFALGPLWLQASTPAPHSLKYERDRKVFVTPVSKPLCQCTMGVNATIRVSDRAILTRDNSCRAKARPERLAP